MFNGMGNSLREKKLIESKHVYKITHTIFKRRLIKLDFTVLVVKSQRRHKIRTKATGLLVRAMLLSLLNDQI